MSSEPGRLASGQLTTLDCVAQPLAVGPIFSAAKRPAVLTSGLYVLAIGGFVTGAAIYFGISAHAFFDAHLSIPRLQPPTHSATRAW